MSNSDPVRVVGITMGDVVNLPVARVKYGYLLTAVAQHLSLVHTIDATLNGWNRWLNGLLSFHPQRQRWRLRFYKNTRAFRQRSQVISGQLYRLQNQVDVVLQVGAMFDACWPTAWLPNVIYTDYTAYLSAQKPAAGRSPLSASQYKTWLGLERRAYLQADHICTRSQMVRQSLIEHYGIAPQKITAVGGGVNFPFLPEIKPQQKETPPTALFVGSDFYRKGGDLLLVAFAQVRQQIPNARLLLLTCDPIPSDLPLHGVKLAPSNWNRNNIINLYRQADVFVLPSRLETWGDVLLEAMAFGIPCIGVRDDAMAEIIDHEQTGLLVESENVDELASAMKHLLSNPMMRDQYGRAARQRVEKAFTWEQVSGRLAEILRSVVECHTVETKINKSTETGGNLGS